MKTEPSLTSVTTRLRHAIMWMFAHEFLGELSSDETTQETARQCACNFVAFGANARLMTTDECNDWLDAIWKRKGQTMVAVLKKWEPSWPGKEQTNV